MSSPSSPAFDVNEVQQLIRYATSKGMDKDTIMGLQKALLDHQDKPDDATKITAVLGPYSDLSRLCGDVTGRSLIDSKRSYLLRFFHFGSFYLWLFVFIIFSIGSDLMDVWLANIPSPDGGDIESLQEFHRNFMKPLEAFSWGGLGSCVFLLKRIWDLHNSRTFEQNKFNGWGVRILLGAILGGVMEYLFIAEDDAGVGVQINVLAFLTGVGVKAFYGAIERIIEEIAAKLQPKSMQPPAAIDKIPSPQGGKNE